MNTLSPTSLKDREIFMDVLRGVAILGIFIANLQFFAYYSSKNSGAFIFPSLDKQFSFLHAMFIEGKFYSIFSLLFGWGLALQINRSAINQNQNINIIRRRLWFMLLLGSVHLIFIWIGDIVAFYAILGFILLALRKRSNEQLIYTAIFLIASPIALYYLKMKFQWLNAPAGILFEASNYLQEHFADITPQRGEEAIIKDGKSIIATIKVNMANAPFRYAYLFFVSRVPKVLGMMLIGFVIGRTGFYQKIHTYNKQLKYFIIVALLISIPANFLLAKYMEHPEHYYNLEIEGWYETIVYALGVAPLALVYVLLMAYVFKHKYAQKILVRIAPVGKMAFTNYIMQSIIGITTFYGIGMGYMQQVGTFALTIFAIIFFIVQIIYSTLWLTYFQFGPFEWLWRSLTYAKRQKMLK